QSRVGCGVSCAHSTEDVVADDVEDDGAQEQERERLVEDGPVAEDALRGGERGEAAGQHHPATGERGERFQRRAALRLLTLGFAEGAVEMSEGAARAEVLSNKCRERDLAVERFGSGLFVEGSLERGRGGL